MTAQSATQLAQAEGRAVRLGITEGDPIWFLVRKAVRAFHYGRMAIDLTHAAHGPVRQIVANAQALATQHAMTPRCTVCGGRLELKKAVRIATRIQCRDCGRSSPVVSAS